MNRAGLSASGIHLASFGGVQSHLVSGVSLIYCLDDIDFSIPRPVAWVSKPNSRPCSAPIGCVLNVEYKESGVELFLRCDAYRVATALCVGVRRVCSQESGRFASISQVG